ncbi:hypothetical protein ACS0TY_035172 [Phlomoides rotata]
MGFYGFPDRSLRHLSWNLLRQLASINNLPWVCIRDFNDLLSADDKKGHVDHPQWLFRGSQDAVFDCALIDIPLMGYKFTWFRSRGSSSAIEERLDRVMGNPTWHVRFPRASLLNLVATISDHNPILLSTKSFVHVPRFRSFIFENRWLMENDLKTVVNKCWLGFRGLRLTDCLADTLDLCGNSRNSEFRVWMKKLERMSSPLFDSHEGSCSSVGIDQNNDNVGQEAEIEENVDEMSEEELERIEEQPNEKGGGEQGEDPTLFERKKRIKKSIVWDNMKIVKFKTKVMQGRQ